MKKILSFIFIDRDKVKKSKKLAILK